MRDCCGFAPCLSSPGEANVRNHHVAYDFPVCPICGDCLSWAITGGAFKICFQFTARDHLWQSHLGRWKQLLKQPQNNAFVIPVVQFSLIHFLTCAICSLRAYRPLGSGQSLKWIIDLLCQRVGFQSIAWMLFPYYGIKVFDLRCYTDKLAQHTNC